MKFTFSFISFILWLSLSLQAQDPNNLAVDGTVKDEDGGRITGASIALYQDGVELKRVTTGNNGRFDLYLDFGHEYIIEISKSSYVTKKLYLNTNNVPVDEQLWGYEFGGFVVDMFKRMDGVDYSILDKPIGKVYYEPNVENFVDDKLYTREIKAEVDRLEQAQKDKIKAEKEQEKRLEEDYQLAIKDAQAAIDDGDYLLAKDNLLAAQSMQPDSKIASQMLSQVESKLNTEGAAQEKYLSVLASADQAFGNQNYEAAIAAYQEALALKPSEDYPKNRLKESQELFAKQKLEREAAAALAAKDKQYNDEIAKADAAYAKNEFTNARALYQNALKYKDDAYPKSKLNEIEIRLADLALEQEKKQKQAQIDAAYADKIDKANTAFNTQNYQLAEQHYQAALGIKPDEVYPKTQLEVIQTKLSELAEADKLQAEKLKLDNDYKTAIARADKAYAAKSYEVAKTEYQAALSIKPKEIYPSDLVKKIDAELSRLAALESENAKKEAELKKQKEYEGLIAVANEDFGKKDWNTAIANYKLALGLKPNESYPKTQISLAEAEIAKVSKQAELDDAYNKRIASGDAAFNRGEYANAIAEYNGALSVKANEKYPTDRIKEAQAILLQEQERIAKDQEAQAAMDAQYAGIIKEADQAFSGKNYNLALSRYSAALKLKTDPYPKERINEIESIQAKEKEAQAIAAKEAEIKKKYDDAIAKADQLLAQKKYDEAKLTYNLAAGYRASEEYPKNKIAEIEGILNSIAAAQSAAEAEAKAKEAYENLLKRAQGELDAGDYRAARASYTEAQSQNPSDPFPTSQIKKIDQLIVEKEAKEKEETAKANLLAEYNNYMRSGNEAMVSKDYVVARTSYTAALAIFPDEAIPKSKLSMIDDLEQKAEQARIKEEYNAAIAIADKFFLDKNYEEAKTKYQDALTILPGQSHAQERLQKCDEMIAELSKVAATEEEDNKRRVIEETFDEGRTKVTVRRVIVNGREEVYKRVVHSWGGKYYFLDEQPITELVWNRETVK
jgi:tetratricopeptide (TPR) repeat protein